MTKPKYFKHPNKRYKDNPLIEAIGLSLTVEQLYSKCDNLFQSEFDLTDFPPELHGCFLRDELDNLVDVYVTQDEAYRIYDIIRRMIFVGYADRNPLNSGRSRVLAAIEKDSVSPMKNKHLNALDLVLNNQCYFLAGLSGRGKTLMLSKIMSLFPSAICHTRYNLSDGTATDRIVNYEQIPSIYVQVHDRNRPKAFLTKILEAIDRATKTTDYTGDHEKSTKDQLITAVRKAALIHSIGIIIIDEAQNLGATITKDTVTDSEKTTMKFVEELFNVIGVPLFFVGTLSALTTFTKEVTIIRRTMNSGSFILGSCELESIFWKRFVKEICQTYLLKNQNENIETLTLHIHELCAGIPAIALSVVKATLAYLTFLPAKEQDLTIDALDYIFEEQCRMLKEPLDALHNEEYHLYDDFELLATLESIAVNTNPESLVAEATEQLERAVETKVSKLKTGELKLIENAPNSLTTPEKKSLDELSPDSLLANIGYEVVKGGSNE